MDYINKIKLNKTRKQKAGNKFDLIKLRLHFKFGIYNIFLVVCVCVCLLCFRADLFRFWPSRVFSES